MKTISQHRRDNQDFDWRSLPPAPGERFGRELITLTLCMAIAALLVLALDGCLRALGM
jgi:hypothetical protein